MKPARIIVLVIAVAAGGVAAMLASREAPAPVQEVVAPPKVDTVDVLVAKADIAMGQVVKDQDMQWQAWPPSAANANFVRRTDKPQALEQLAGSISRSPFVAGEPIREGKLIKANGSGFMAAILPSGMRAISVEISPETGAGGFILPNDRVDVILTRREREAEKRAGGDVHTSTTILSNIRVLAIDQAVEEKNGQRVVVGKTATLELAQLQAERLALSRQLGSLSLALRSIADTNAVAQNDTPRETVIVVQRGVERETFNCIPRCERRMTSGDGADPSNPPAPAPQAAPRNGAAEGRGNSPEGRGNAAEGRGNTGQRSESR